MVYNLAFLNIAEQSRLLPALEREERKQLLSDAIAALPERERLVVTLYYMEDLRLMTDLGNLAAAAYQTYATERKRTEQTLRDSEEQYRLVVETATQFQKGLVGSNRPLVVN